MKKILSGGIYKVFLIRLLFAFLLFSVTRILFFISNHGYFSDITFSEFFRILFFGLRFDLPALILCYSLFILLSIIPFHLKSAKTYQLILKIVYVISTVVALSGNLIDCGYFKFTLSRSTADIFTVLGFGSDFFTLLPQYLKDFWYLFLIWIILVVLSAWFFNKTKVTEPLDKPKENYFLIYIKETLIFICIGALCIVGFRGGLQLRPIGIITAGEYTSAKNVALVLNTPFTIVKTFGKPSLKEKKYFNDKVLDSIFSPKHFYFQKDRPAKRNNVVIIILESFSKEYIGELNKNLDNGSYKGYTPFLDSLIKESLIFTNAYANGKRSIEGIPAVLSGIPSLMDDAYITSRYSGNSINSIANLLKTKGYSTAFFHGGTNGTMGFDNYTRIAGFDKYYGRTEYNNEKDFDGKWGIFDEEFLQFVADKLNSSAHPIVAGIFTLSSHHPYTIPAKYPNKFPKGRLPIHQSIEYADYALGRFFKTLSTKPWFDSTLFVITADHTSESFYPQYQTRAGMYKIPILFYQHNNSKLKGKSEEIVEQSDILPSVLDFLNYDKPFINFGVSVFDTAAFHFAVNYKNGTYQLIYKNYSYVFDGTTGVSLHYLPNDSLMKFDLLKNSPAIKKEIEQKLKAIIQSFNQRMIKNNLTLK